MGKDNLLLLYKYRGISWYVYLNPSDYYCCLSSEYRKISLWSLKIHRSGYKGKLITNAQCTMALLPLAQLHIKECLVTPEKKRVYITMGCDLPQLSLFLCGSDINLRIHNLAPACTLATDAPRGANTALSAPWRALAITSRSWPSLILWLGA